MKNYLLRCPDNPNKGQKVQRPNASLPMLAIISCTSTIASCVIAVHFDFSFK